MTPVEDYTVENWLKGDIVNHEDAFRRYFEIFERGGISKEDFKKIESEAEKIHKLQKKAFDEVVANNMKYMKFFFERSCKEAKDKKDYIRLEKQKIEKWLNAHPQLKMNIFSANIDVSFFDSKQYNKYRGEFIVQQRILDNGYTKCYRDTKLYKEYMDSILKQSYSSLFPSFMFYHDEPNIKASVYTIYLKYLEELDPKEFLTLRDFYTEDDDCYRTHMDMLTEPLKADYDKLQNDLPAIAEKRNDKYYFINDTPNQQYLGAFLVHLACEEFFVFRNISRRQLSDIIKRTFNCDSFNPNLANTILKKRKCDFDDKYFVYFPQDND